MNDALIPALRGAASDRSATVASRGAGLAASVVSAAADPAAVERFRMLWESVGQEDGEAAAVTGKAAAGPAGLREAAEPSLGRPRVGTDAPSSAQDGGARAVAGMAVRTLTPTDVLTPAPVVEGAGVSPDGDVSADPSPEVPATDARRSTPRPARHGDGEPVLVDRQTATGGAASSLSQASTSEDNAVDGLGDDPSQQPSLALLVAPPALPVAAPPPERQLAETSASQAEAKSVNAGVPADGMAGLGYPVAFALGNASALPSAPSAGQAPPYANASQASPSARAPVAAADARSCVVYPNLGGADAGLAVKVTHSTSAMQVQFHCASIEQKRRLEPRGGTIVKSLGQQLRISVEASFDSAFDPSDATDDFE
ncbi:MAG: hypothetical protein ACRYG5_06280 [Janthinobacterium lividum]